MDMTVCRLRRMSLERFLRSFKRHGIRLLRVVEVARVIIALNILYFLCS
jgi:hypothetical protein